MSGSAAALILALGVLPGRDHAAGALLLVGALALAARTRGLPRGLALGVALAGLVSFVPVARTPLGHTAGVLVGDAAFLGFAALLAPRALRETRHRPVRWVALLPALSCAASWFAPNMRIAILSSATFTRIAVLFGLVLFVYAAGAGERSLESLAFVSLASCFFAGWRTLLLVLLEGWILVSPDVPSLPGRLRGAMPPLACLTLLVLLNGGYGLSRIDLTLVVLGDTDPIHPSVVWGATAVLLSYAVSLVAALRLAVRMTRSPLGENVAQALSSFVLFTGTDFLWLGAARPGVLLTVQLEEQLIFDVVLSGLLLALAAATALLERGRPALREITAPGFSDRPSPG